MYGGLLKQETGVLEQGNIKNLMETISFYDYKEDYYHGFLAGLLKMMDGYVKVEPGKRPWEERPSPSVSAIRRGCDNYGA